MSTKIRRIIDMVLRVLGFVHAHPSDDAGYIVAVARLEDRAARLQTFAEQEQSGRIAEEAATIGKKDIRRKVRDDFAILARIAGIAAREEPTIPVRLSIPRPHTSQQAFLAGGRVVVGEARAAQSLLTKYGLTPELLDGLSAMLDQYQVSIGDKNTGVTSHVGANAEMQELAIEVGRLVGLLDAFYRPRFHNDPEKRAAWKSAKDVVRSAPKSAAEPARPGGDAAHPAA